MDGTVYGVTGNLVTDNNGTLMMTGDNSGNLVYRSFVSFTLNLPTSAKISSAILKVYLDQFSDNPLSLGAVQVDHITYATFTTAIFAQAALDSNIGTLIATTETEKSASWHQLDVTSQVQDDFKQKRAHAQFRLYHPTGNNDGQQDNEMWNTGDATDNQPQLVVTYTL